MQLGKSLFLGCIIWLLTFPSWAARIFIPMNADDQTNHLKAYGVAYYALQQGIEVDWLLNYEGGSFAMLQVENIERICRLRGVDYQVMSDAQYNGILTEIADPDFNADIIRL